MDMAQCYRVDSRKITLREYWNILPSWKALVPWVAKWLNIQMPFGSGFRLPDTVRELEVAESEFSPHARAKLQPLLDGNLLIPLRNEADLRSYPTAWVHNYITYLRTSIATIHDRLELAEHVSETAVDGGVLPHITVSKKRRLDGSGN